MVGKIQKVIRRRRYITSALDALEDYTFTEDGIEIRPTLVYDRANNFSGSRTLDENDYIAEENVPAPALIYDRQNSFSGSSMLTVDDYAEETQQPVLVYDRQNSFGGSQ